MNQLSLGQTSLVIPPKKMKATQKWFASIITSPLHPDNTTQTLTPSGHVLEEEARHYIRPSPTLAPHQRIGIYNQQYWWRLLKILQENFPLLTRLFSPYVFNQTVLVPYLLENPPPDWDINRLGSQLPDWILQNYTASDQWLVHASARLDVAFIDSFIAPLHPPLDLQKFLQEDPEEMLEQVFFLQPFLHLFEWNYDLFSFRKEVLKEEPNHWIAHPFPPIPPAKGAGFILYRNRENNNYWDELTAGAYFVLRKFQEGVSIASLCETIETLEESLQQEIESHLQNWLKNWAQWGWLTTVKNRPQNQHQI